MKKLNLNKWHDCVLFKCEWYGVLTVIKGYVVALSANTDTTSYIAQQSETVGSHTIWGYFGVCGYFLAI